MFVVIVLIIVMAIKSNSSGRFIRQGMDGNVQIASQTPLFHFPIADIDVFQERLERRYDGCSFVSSMDLGSEYDFDECGSSPIEVDSILCGIG